MAEARVLVRWAAARSRATRTGRSALSRLHTTMPLPSPVRAVARRAVDAEALLAAREHLLHPARCAARRLRDGQHVAGLVRRGGRSRPRDRPRSGRARSCPRPGCASCGGRRRTASTTRGCSAPGRTCCARAATGGSSLVCPRQPASATDGERGAERSDEAEVRAASRRRPPRSPRRAPRAPTRGAARVLSTSNFGSSASIEMKNLSSLAARKRSDSKIGWWCRGSWFRPNMPNTAPNAERRIGQLEHDRHHRRQRAAAPPRGLPPTIERVVDPVHPVHHHEGARSGR